MIAHWNWGYPVGDMTFLVVERWLWRKYIFLADIRVGNGVICTHSIHCPIIIIPRRIAIN